MLPEESPFPCHWWGTELERAGLGAVRPRVGTYGRYGFSQLPPLPFAMRGDFAWLHAAATQGKNIRDGIVVTPSESLDALKESSARLGLSLPSEFTHFLGDESLQQRVRSNTACYLDVTPEPVRSPVGDGHLVRFLADSSGCLFWYLYLPTEGVGHAVVCSPGFYGTEEEERERQKEPPAPGEIAYAAESFEGFLCRFWLENEIWYAAHHNAPMPAFAQEYIAAYRERGL